MTGISLHSMEVVLRIYSGQLLTFPVGSRAKHGNVLFPEAVVSRFQRGHVTPEEELAFHGRIATMCALHVGIDAAQRDVQVQVKSQDDASKQSYERRERCIFEIGELNFHTSELRSPSNMGVVWAFTRRRRLPANRLPGKKEENECEVSAESS
jgi:hypothetical protein